MKAILAIDQGTTGPPVAVMNTRGVLLGSVNYEFPQIYPKPGWVEHAPEAIWAAALKGIRGVFRRGLGPPPPPNIFLRSLKCVVDAGVY